MRFQISRLVCQQSVRARMRLVEPVSGEFRHQVEYFFSLFCRDFSCGASGQKFLPLGRHLGVVLAHTAPVRPPSIDLDDTARLLREHDNSVEAKFRASVEAERNKEDVLARKFAENLKKAKDAPLEKPIRDFDLD